MSELQMDVSSPDSAAGRPSGAGAQLRAAREAAGIHIAALAGALKVPVARLEALEAERFDLMPDPPFVRALAGSVCRVLKLDPTPILAQLPQRKPTRLEDEVRGTAATRFKASNTHKANFFDQFSKPVMFAVGVLLLGVIALVSVPSERWSNWKTSLQDGLSSPATEDQKMTEPVAAAAPNVAAEVSLPVATPPLATAGAQAQPVTTATSPDPASAVEAVVPASGVVVFSATGDSWIKVTDARGGVVLQKLLVAGVSQAANGDLPLAVVIGRADVTQVQVRGKPFDLAAIARNNVARFEVK